MTAIVGLIDDGKVFIGGDNAETTGWYGRTDLADSISKVFNNGPYIIGTAGSSRVAQRLQYHVKIPVPPRDIDHEDNDAMLSFVIKEIVPAIQDKLGQKKSGCTFILGYRDKLYQIYTDYSVSIRSHGYQACGCGEDFALGSLFTTDGAKKAPRDRVTTALEAAAEFSSGVAGPFTILETQDV